MDEPSDTTVPQRIDLTQQMDVAYWCRFFGVSAEQLRDAVHHAGHRADEVQRYLLRKAGNAG